MSQHAHFTLMPSPYGVHPATAPRERSAPVLQEWVEIARLAERAGIDALFIADSPGVTVENARVGKFEPLTVLSALAHATEGIGLVGTASTSFNEPYNVARQFASLHLLSGGRAGWNSVGTSHPGSAENFGDTEWTDHARRYRIGHEFTEVVHRLWSSPGDRIDHEGEFFSVRGPIDVDLPHGPPLIAQAGGSPEGLRLAARFADLTFAILPDLAAATAYAERLRAAEEQVGRPPGSVRLLPGVVPYLAATQAEAAAYKEGLDSRVDTTPLLPVVGRYLHVDPAVLAALDLDAPFPLDVLTHPDDVHNSVGTYTSLYTVIEQTRPSTRALLLKASGGNRHREFVGTPDSFADELETWLGAGASDGATLLLPSTARDLPFFADHVTPLLRARGLLPEVPATSLRERLGTGVGVG